MTNSASTSISTYSVRVLQDSLMSCIGLKNIFDIKEKEKIYNTFILVNFNYCPTIWHLRGKISTKKIERIRECALRVMFNDHCRTYPALLEKCNYTTLHVRRIKTIACEVF